MRGNQQLEKYQEQPSLLDPHMEGLVVPLMRRVRAHRDRSVAGSSEPEEDAFVLAIFRLLYTLCKVRGYKTVGMSLHCAAMPHLFYDHRASLMVDSPLHLCALVNSSLLSTRDHRPRADLLLHRLTQLGTYPLPRLLSSTSLYPQLMRISRWQLNDAGKNAWDSAGVSDDELGWERRYVLFLWLSIICLIPFNLASFPSRQSSSTVLL